MQNFSARTGLFRPARLAMAAVCLTIAAHGGALSVTSFTAQVAGGSVVDSSLSTSWGGLFPSLSATTASETWDYGDTSVSGIFLLPSSSNIFGLTNSEFRCGLVNVSGCGGLGITFTLLGVAVSSLPVSGNLIIGLDGSTTFSGALQALYAVSDSGPTAVPLAAPSGSIPLSSAAGSFTASNAGTPVLFSCSFCSTSSLMVNITINLLIKPSTVGARFSDGDTVTLPSSFSVTVIDSAVPEPASGVTMGLALAALAAWWSGRWSANRRFKGPILITKSTV